MVIANRTTGILMIKSVMSKDIGAPLSTVMGLTGYISINRDYGKREDSKCLNLKMPGKPKYVLTENLGFCSGIRQPCRLGGAL